MAGDTLEVFLVERLDGVTVADAAEAALADLLDEDGEGVWAGAFSLELLLGVSGEEVDLSFEVDRPSGEVEALLLEVLFGSSSTAPSFSELASTSSSSSVDSSAFLFTTSTSLSATSTPGSVSPSLSLSLIVDSL